MKPFGRKVHIKKKKCCLLPYSHLYRKTQAGESWYCHNPSPSLQMEVRCWQFCVRGTDILDDKLRNCGGNSKWFRTGLEEYREEVKK